ncbi:MAG: NusG domain II-containing protein [Clostridia bacterium]|nr:NusG domain II-containing protein [Clostridia bacterium]
MKRGDLIIIVAALVLGLLLLFLPATPGASLTVISDGGAVGTYPLSQDLELTVGGNTVVISDGAVYMKAADCPGGDCLSARKISRAGESIVCLPNRLVLRIDGKPEDGPDAMTGGVGG